MQIFNKKNRKKVCLMLLAGLICVVMSTTNPLVTEAANFAHRHTGACYKTGMGPCNATHKQSTRTEGTTAHCSNCGTSTAQTMYVNWDHCYGIGADYELGGKKNCNVCGSTTYQWGGNSSWNHQVSQQILSCGKGTSATGQLWLKNNTVEWTKENVVLEAGVDIYSNELTLHTEPYSWDNQTTWTTENSKTITENGVYTISAKSSSGVVVTETVTVSNIDRTGPGLASVDKSETEWTNQDIVLMFHGVDTQPEGSAGSGLADNAYSFDRGATYTEENSLTVSGNGTYEVWMMDRLGNVGTGTVEVSNIDKNAPVISGISPLEDGWQSESVTMQIQAADPDGECGLHNEAFSLDGGNTWQENAEFLIVENGEYQIRVRDLVGNVVTQDFTVNLIDRTAPIVEELLVVQDKIYADKVYVMILAKDLQPDGSTGMGLHNVAYSLDGGETWQEENGFWVEKGKSYDVRVRDGLEWMSEELVVVRENFPYPQMKEENANPTQNGNPPSVIPEVSVEELPEETEKVKESSSKEENTVQTGVPIGDITGMYEYGNWFEHRDVESPAGTEDAGTTMEENAKKSESVVLEPKMSEKKNPVHVVTPVWYTTPIGKTVIVSAGTLAAGTMIGALLWLYLFSVPVYCMEEKNRLYHLGRVLLHRTRDGYSVYLSDFMLQTSTLPKYRIKVSGILLKKMENERLLIESEEKNLEVLIQETIDFEL